MKNSTGRKRQVSSLLLHLLDLITSRSRPCFIFRFFCICFCLALFAACASKPNQEELNRLEDARKAAASAEAQLQQLKKERLELEEELARQKKLLEQKQKEVDDTKSTMPE
ncbi:hypothetical protein ACFL5V_02290 [Fibrobacterota bacterium]